MNLIRLSLLLIVLVFANPAKGQLISSTTYEFDLGFYAGQPAYWGDYSGGLMGKGYPFDNVRTKNKVFGSDINYGFSGWFPLYWGFGLRSGIEYGTLGYEIEDTYQPYFMSTPYHAFNAHLQYSLDFGSDFIPYISAGYEELRFKTPAQNANPDFLLSSPLRSYQSGKAHTIPVIIGFEYNLGDYSSVFMESSLRFTSTDYLDNFNPQESTFKQKNDAIFTWQAGLKVKVIHIIKLLFSSRKAEDLIAYEVPSPKIDWSPPVPELIPIPDKFGVPPTVKPKPEPVAPVTVAPPPIAMVTPENRTFDRDAEMKKLEDLRKQKEDAPPSIPENSNLNWDPTIPIIQTMPSGKPADMESGFITNQAPEGYYVQIYASVGPITATGVRNRIIEETKRQNLLADPEHQIIIMTRKQFYEVRIGVFDSYEDTLRVLEAMQGIFIDSYSLIYLPDNQ